MNSELLASNLTAHWIQAGVLSLCALAALRAFRVRDPRLVLATLQGALLVILLLPWLQDRQVVGMPQVGAAQSAAVMSGVGGAPPVQDLVSRPAEVPVNLAAILLAVLAAGVLFRLALLTWGAVRLRRFARQALPVAPPDVAQAFHAQLGISPTYVTHPDVRSPSSFGIVIPHVVLPNRFDELGESQRRAIVCHELIHVKRRDVAFACAEELVLAGLWFHPWLWAIRRRIRIAREQTVDLRVLELVGNRAEYVRCLIQLAGHDLGPHLAPGGAAMARTRELRERVDAMFQEVSMSRPRFATVSALLALIVAAAGWAAATQAPLHAMAPQQTVMEPRVTPPGRMLVEPAGAALTDRFAQPSTASAATRSSSPVTGSLPLPPTLPRSYALNPQGTPAEELPRPLLKVAYGEYPSDALEKQISGIVVLNITINASGDVSTAAVISGPDALRATAFKTAMGLKFGPAAGTTATTVGIEYRLDRQSWGVRVISPMAAGLTTAAGTLSLALQRMSASMQSLGANLQSEPGTVQIAPDAAPDRTPSGAVPMGGNVAAPRKIKDVPPIYPALARQSMVQGVVILEAIVGVTGEVTDVRVLRSIPLLDQAAIDAVKQWQYSPTLLNGVPVPVIMTVTVNFAVRTGTGLNITSPSGVTTRVQIGDSGYATVAIPDLGRLSFTSSPGSSGSSRVIAIYDASDQNSPARLLGQVEVTLGAGKTQSPSTPSFGIELTEVP